VFASTLPSSATRGGDQEAPVDVREGRVNLQVVTVEKDQEVVETINNALAQLGIRDASISLIGAVHQSTVSVMNKDDAPADRLRSYDQPFELTGTGVAWVQPVRGRSSRRLSPASDGRWRSECCRPRRTRQPT
jgi:hypothetical protein